MRIDLLPDMQTESLLCRSGGQVEIFVENIQYQGRHHIFLREQHRFSESSIASNAMTFVEQLLRRYQLEPKQSHFYRYVYTPTVGALFGCFSIDWQSGSAASYSFKMLNQLEAQQQLEPIIKLGQRALENIEIAREATGLVGFGAVPA